MTDAEAPSVDRQIRALVEVIGTLAGTVSQLSGRVDQLTAQVQPGRVLADGEPPPWVPVAPEPAPEDDTAAVVDNFVAFYNQNYVGVAGGRATAIPPCWRQHPGLAAEVASLAYTWRAANMGPAANICDAQQWLHQWRPGFTDRMTRDWLPLDCLDGLHC